MDIRKLVNQGQARPMDAQYQTALPSLSSMFPDPSYAPQPQATAYHYPVAPQGEGYSYHFHPHQAPAAFYPQVSFAPYSNTPYSNPSARNSSSAISVSSTKYSASVASSSSAGPAMSAERRSLSDEDMMEDDESESEHRSSNSSSPSLPPYAAQPPAQDFMCDDCGVGYSRAPDLRRHKASVHQDRDSREKVAATFPCEVCGQVLLSSHGYQGHMRRHYDERPFVCEAPFCGKAFHDSATLARHRRTHSAEHKFECDFCGRRFKRKDNLNTHRKKHQVGGETINPNLLRKPVTRVSGSSDSPPHGTPAYNELPLAPAYQPTPAPAPAPMSIPVPPYTHQQPTFQQQPQYATAPPYYQTTFAPYPQQYVSVKAEDINAPRMMVHHQHQHLPPVAR